MVLDRVLGVLGGMNVMTVRQVRVVGRLFVVSTFVVRGGFVVMARSVLMMFCRLGVMMGCFV